MSIYYIVDASVAAKWYFNEEHTGAAMRLLRAGHRLEAPQFFLLEMDSVFCARIRRGQIAEAKADEIRAAVRQLTIRLYPDALLADLAYEVAKQVRRSPYDCLYLALADLVGERMVTADRRFYEAIAGTPLGQHVLWVEDVP